MGNSLQLALGICVVGRKNYSTFATISWESVAGGGIFLYALITVFVFSLYVYMYPCCAILYVHDVIKKIIKLECHNVRLTLISHSYYSLLPPAAYSAAVLFCLSEEGRRPSTVQHLPQPSQMVSLRNCCLYMYCTCTCA